MSLQIDILQFLITGRISEILSPSNRTHLSLKAEIISFKIFCSSSFCPVARKNLQSYSLRLSSINSTNLLAGVLFVGPEPPTPSKIFI